MITNPGVSTFESNFVPSKVVLKNNFLIFYIIKIYLKIDMFSIGFKYL